MSRDTSLHPTDHQETQNHWFQIDSLRRDLLALQDFGSDSGSKCKIHFPCGLFTSSRYKTSLFLLELIHSSVWMASSARGHFFCHQCQPHCSTSTNNFVASASRTLMSLTWRQLIVTTATHRCTKWHDGLGWNNLKLAGDRGTRDGSGTNRRGRWLLPAFHLRGTQRSTIHSLIHPSECTSGA